MRLSLLATAVAALPLSCIAQDFIGFTYNNQIGATSRGSISVNAGEVMTRLDSDEHAGWGVDTPGFRTIASVFAIIQDQDALNTPETYDIVLYPEDPTNPGFPDLATPIPFASGLAGPAAPASGTINATAAIVTPTTPVAVPIQGGGDVFVSFVLPANAGWPATDGLSVQIVLGYAPTASFLVFDTPGLAQGATPPPAGSPADSHGLSRIGAGPATYNARRHHMLDIAHSTAGGVGLAITNQTSYTSSNSPPPAGWGPAPGTADFMSGSNPDVVGGNVGRADDFTMEFFSTGFGTGNLVLFQLSFAANWGPELPLSNFVAGSTGVVCLDQSSAQTLGIAFANNDEAFLTTTVPAALRPTLAGLPVKQQAFGFTSAFTLVASPCDGMVF